VTSQQAKDPTAVMGRRIVAHLVDTILYAAAFAIPFALLATSQDIPRALGDDDVSFEWVNDQAVLRVADTVWILDGSEFWTTIGIGAGVFLLSTVLIEGLRGRTLGKSLTGIRTVRADGEPPGIGRAFLRTLLWIVDQFPTGFAFPLVGGVAAFASRGHRRVGDMAGGTYVVGRAYVSQPVNPEGAVAATSAARSWEPGAETWEPTEPSPAPTFEPQWDPARKAYIQWDPRRQAWLQYDDDAKEWRPIS
jgi:uncharacterized RDD family membrane protein YckC